MPRSAARPRSARPPAATVTRAFLFSDLRDYTDFVETHGDAAAADLLHAYREIVRASVDRYAGAEVKTEGDSFYVVFEAPSTAVECAVAVQRAVHEHAGRDTKALLRVGIGLHAGETVPYDDQFVGSAVNIAARLASKAKAGEIIASDTLRGLVRTAVRYEMEDRGPLRLKGLGERVRAWSVQWREVSDVAPAAPAVPSVPLPLLAGTVTAPAAPVPGQIVCPIVVGREAEHARFAEIIGRAAAGRGEAVVLSGEAGVGKSAFTRSSIAAAGQAGFRVLYGATLEADRGLPYAPFVAAVRSGFRGIARDRLGKVLAQASPDLAQLFPELGKAQRADSATAVEQHRLSVAFFGLFTTFAREGPVLVVVEDLHWADEASLALFHYLARELRDSRVVLLGTYRSDEMHRRHPFLRALASMQRERVVSEITLDRLDREQVRELIRATFGSTSPVSDEFRDAIYARSEGNPFFTEELLKSLVESGGLYYTTHGEWERKPIGELRIPGSIREAVRERIDRLSAEAQTTVSTAAVFGLRVAFDLLRAVRGVTEAQLEAQLRELIEQQLVVELGGDDDEYGFRHALTKEVVYDDLLVRERKRIHRGVADALASDPSAEPAVLAHHLMAAGEASAAVPHLLAAAAKAFRAFAARESAAHYEKAIELGLTDRETPEVLERLAEAYYSFDFARARKVAEEAATAYRALGDVRGVSRALRLASRSMWQQGDAGRAAVLAKGAIDALAGLEETLELGRATANMGILRMVARANEEATTISDRAIELGRRFDDPWTIANGLINRGTALARSDFESGDRDIRAGIDLAVRRGLPETALRGYNNLFVAGWAHFSSEEFDRQLEEAQAYAQAHGLEDPVLKHVAAFSDWTRGEWDRASAAAEAVPEGSYWIDAVTDVLAWIALGREGPHRAIAMRESGAANDARSPDPQSFATAVCVMALLHIHLDQREAARRWFDLLTDRAAADPGIALVLAAGSSLLPVCTAAYFDSREWLDRIERAKPGDPAQAKQTDLALAVGRALFGVDPVGCAHAVSELLRGTANPEGGALPSFAIVASEELLRRGATLGPEWRRPFAEARAFSERARAPWYLAKLDELEAKIRV